ncbi:cell well associated RhsD protein [Bacteroidia bacterium]|nr:cell well associated RhsD protein [Bacteroidia bacterium]GHT48677.1 cell well associated RhsD protein [Bacteroidia bacterium]
MKQSILFVLFLNVFWSAYTQNTAPSQDQNYIKTRTYTKGDASAYLDAVHYFDGLGRPVQQVQVGFTPSQTDWVAFQEYDAYGREWKSWLPVNTGSGSGHFRDLEDLKSRTNTAYGTEPVRYSETQYEPSPLNRVEKQYGPGQAWRTADRFVQTAYLTNNADDYPCRYYYVSGDNLEKNANDYANGSLFVTQITDEDNKTTYEFKDKLGRVILQRQVDTDGNYDTYYVYDDFGNRRFVLPPLIEDDISSANLNKYAYSYQYDDRQRCTEMKLPGADPVYYIYDQADRLIFSQDGEQRSPNNWTFNKYDAFGRVIVSGVWKNVSMSRASLIDLVKNIAVIETNSAAGEYGYSKNQLQNIPAGSILQANYYDNPDNLLNTNDLAATIKDKVSYAEKAGYDKRYENSKGLLVGTRVKMLDDTSKEIVTAFYYDSKGRIVQQRSTNLLGGREAEYYVYSFTGQPTEKQHVHAASHLGNDSITESYTYHYDHANRPTITEYQVGGNKITLSELTYDDLSRVKTKGLHGNKELISYDYTVRSWLGNIDSPHFMESLYYTGGNTPLFNGNMAKMEWSSNSNPLQGYSFTYDNLNRLKKADYFSSGSVNRYNDKTEEVAYDKMGNITSLKRSRLSMLGLFDDLDMEYSGNQLNKVTESADVDEGFIKPLGNPAREYVYNKNGALEEDFNQGITGIQYNVLNLPNKITFSTGNSTQYSYDATGVKRRRIHMAAQTTISGIPVNRHIRAGFMILPGSLSNTVTDYCGSVIYENGELKYILNPEGYVTKNSTNNYRFNYYLKDHLGNNRVVMEIDNSNSVVMQTTDYYPFGMPYTNGEFPERQPYKFGGKELDEVYGLNWYDFEARQLSMTIPRFTTMDPRAEKYYSVSPYAYCMNNPVNYIDPDGRTVYFYRDNGNGEFEQVEFSQLDATTQEWLYGWMQSESGQDFLSNFVDGEQSFTWDGNTVTIQGNGNNYDAQYSFGNATTDYRSDGVYTIHGETEWKLYNDKPLMYIHTDISQTTADQITTFGHEHTVHAEQDVDYLNKNFVRGAENNSTMLKGLNTSGAVDHATYDNQNSSRYTNMRRFISGMMGWMGSATMDRALMNAFRKEYQNNKANVKRGK